MKPKHAMLLFCLILVCARCSSDMPLDEFVEWNLDTNNGLSQKTNRGDFNFELTYQPREWVNLQNHRKELPSKGEWNSQLEARKEFQYYKLKVWVDGHPNFLKANLTHDKEYHERLAYYTSFAQNDIQLADGTDTLNCTQYHFERNYGIQPFQTILLGFASGEDAQSSSKTLIFNDRVLNIEPVELTIPKENLQRIPKLKL